MLCTLSSHCTTLYLCCRCDHPGAAFFSPHTADVIFLILQTFSSHSRPCSTATDVGLLMLYTYHTSQPSPCTIDVTLLVLHIFSPYCYCNFPDNAEFLLTPHTLFCYSRCSPFDAVHFPSSYCRCDIPDTADFLLTPHTLSYYCRCRNSCTTSLHTADATILVLYSFSPRIADVTVLLLQAFSSHHTPCPPTADVTLLTDAVHSLLTLHNTLLVLQIRPSWCCILLSSYCRCDIPDTADFLLTPQTLSCYCRCSPSHAVHSLLTLCNLLLVQ